MASNKSGKYISFNCLPGDDVTASAAATAAATATTPGPKGAAAASECCRGSEGWDLSVG